MMSLTIKKRLFLLAIATPLFMGMAILSTYIGYQSIKKATDTAFLLGEVMHHLQTAVKGMGDFVITQGGPEASAATREGLDEANKRFLTFMQSASDSAIDAAMNAQMESVNAEILSFLAIQRDAIDDTAMIRYGRLSVKMDALLARFDQMVDGYQLDVERRKKRVFAVTAGIFILSIASLAFLFFTTYRLIAVRLKRSEEMISAILAGDLTRQADITGADELAEISRAMNQMSLHLKGIILQILSMTDAISSAAATITDAHARVLKIIGTQKGAIEGTSSAIDDMSRSIAGVAEKAGALSSLSESSVSSIVEMESSIASVAGNAVVFNESTEATAASISEMTTAVKQIAENAGHLVVSSEDAAVAVTQLRSSAVEIERSAVRSVGLAESVDVAASEKGLKSLEAMRAGMGATKESVGELIASIQTLGVRSSDIGKVLEVISEITEQATLLALNASILAAQAGEHGKGFSVVATEIHGLSGRTAEHTRAIEAIITSIQKEIKASIGMTQKSMASVERGMALFTDLETAFSGIKQGASTAADMARLIKRAAAEDVTTIDHINTTIQSMKEEIRLIGQSIAEQHKGSRYIVEAAERMRSASLSVKNATQEQSAGSRNITIAISGVSRQASEIAEATEKQKQKSREVVSAVGMITTTLEELGSSSSDLDVLITSLKDQAQNLRNAVGTFKV